jgi:hypothetical protein
MIDIALAFSAIQTLGIVKIFSLGTSTSWRTIFRVMENK